MPIERSYGRDKSRSVFTSGVVDAGMRVLGRVGHPGSPDIGILFRNVRFRIVGRC